MTRMVNSGTRFWSVIFMERCDNIDLVLSQQY